MRFIKKIFPFLQIISLIFSLLFFHCDFNGKDENNSIYQDWEISKAHFYIEETSSYETVDFPIEYHSNFDNDDALETYRIHFFYSISETRIRIFTRVILLDDNDTTLEDETVFCSENDTSTAEIMEEVNFKVKNNILTMVNSNDPDEYLLFKKATIPERAIEDCGDKEILDKNIRPNFFKKRISIF